MPAQPRIPFASHFEPDRLNDPVWGKYNRLLADRLLQDLGLTEERQQQAERGRQLMESLRRRNLLGQASALSDYDERSRSRFENALQSNPMGAMNTGFRRGVDPMAYQGALGSYLAGRERAADRAAQAASILANDGVRVNPPDLRRLPSWVPENPRLPAPPRTFYLQPQRQPIG